MMLPFSLSVFLLTITICSPQCSAMKYVIIDATMIGFQFTRQHSTCSLQNSDKNQQNYNFHANFMYKVCASATSIAKQNV